MARQIIEASDGDDTEGAWDDSNLMAFLRGLMRHRGRWVSGPIISGDLYFTYNQWKSVRRSANASRLVEKRGVESIDPMTNGNRLIFYYRINPAGMRRVIKERQQIAEAANNWRAA